MFAVTALYNFIYMYQLEENIYDRKQENLDKRLENNKKSVEIRANLAKEDEKKMNEFYDRIVTEMWQNYIQG